jgi:hypothetical protein
LKFSMWIIAEALAPYSPEATIVDGSRTLQNVRVISDETEFSRSTVYLEQLDDGVVMCSHGKDMVVAHTDDLNLVLNRILDTFDHYNNWISELEESIREGCPISSIISAIGEELGRNVILTDATYYVREFSLNGNDEIEMPEDVLKAIDDRFMPLETIMNINSMANIRQPNVPTYRVDTKLEEHGCGVTNIFVNGVHDGWLVTYRLDRELTQGELDVQDALAGVVSACLARDQQSEDKMQRSAIFSQLLAGEALEQDEVYQRLRALGWSRDDGKVVYAIRQRDSSKNPHHVVERFLERIEPMAVVFSTPGTCAYAADTSLVQLDSLEQRMAEVLRECGCVAGRSPVFYDIFSLPRQFSAAKVSSEHTDGSALIVHFEEIRLDYVLALLRDPDVPDVRHQAVGMLEEYDNEHGTQLLETLRTYLRCKCNSTETARVLYIHRSTLLYRIKRIEELAKVDFDDYLTRLHLEISCELGNELRGGLGRGKTDR